MHLQVHQLHCCRVTSPSSGSRASCTGETKALIDTLVFGDGERFLRLATMRREGNKISQPRLPRKHQEGIFTQLRSKRGGVSGNREGSDALVTFFPTKRLVTLELPPPACRCIIVSPPNSVVRTGGRAGKTRILQNISALCVSDIIFPAKSRR